MIPFQSETLSTEGLVTLGRVFAYLGEIGLHIYGPVQDPASAPLAILSLALGVKS
jgi:hypothetical protein